jgi:hypothetical protein
VWLEDELNKFQTCCHVLSRSNSHVNKQLCQQHLHTVRRRGWEGSADTEVVYCGNGEARKKDKGKEVGKGEYEGWKGRKRKKEKDHGKGH